MQRLIIEHNYSLIIPWPHHSGAVTSQRTPPMNILCSLKNNLPPFFKKKNNNSEHMCDAVLKWIEFQRATCFPSNDNYSSPQKKALWYGKHEEPQDPWMPCCGIRLRGCPITCPSPNPSINYPHSSREPLLTSISIRCHSGMLASISVCQQPSGEGLH